VCTQQHRRFGQVGEQSRRAGLRRLARQEKEVRFASDDRGPLVSRRRTACWSCAVGGTFASHESGCWGLTSPSC
jgi:hypothetical protein